VISKQGAPVVTFGPGVKAKLSDMSYELDDLTFSLPKSLLLEQGKVHKLGELRLKLTLTFKYETKSCTGVATLKLEKPARVIVRCR
jgi:hypothetical protein